MRYISIILVSLLLLPGCEQTVDAEWPEHDEQLVITGYLQIRQDSVLAFVRVNRTLALSEVFDDSRAIVNDATVQLRDHASLFEVPQDRKYYPFSYDFNYSGVYPRDGSMRYELEVRHEDNTASAILDLDEFNPVFEYISVKPSAWGSNYLDVDWALRLPDRDATGTCYFESWSVFDNEWAESDNIELEYDGKRDGDLLRGSSTIWAYGNRPRLRYILVLRNGVYEDYNDARWSWESGDSPFEPEPTNPPFNITGDGIGFFWYEYRGDPVEVLY